MCIRDRVLEVHFKEIADLIGAEQPIQYHPEGDSFNHTMLVVDKCAQLTSNLEIRFSSLVHDLGKEMCIRDRNRSCHHTTNSNNRTNNQWRTTKRNYQL